LVENDIAFFTNSISLLKNDIPAFDDEQLLIDKEKALRHNHIFATNN